MTCGFSGGSRSSTYTPHLRVTPFTDTVAQPGEEGDPSIGEDGDRDADFPVMRRKSPGGGPNRGTARLDVPVEFIDRVATVPQPSGPVDPNAPCGGVPHLPRKDDGRDK